VQAASTDNTAYDTVDYFVRRVIAPTGADVRVMLAGDWHHYARYTGIDADSHRELITCGGGGAYLYPTHRLPDEIQVPPDASLMLNASPARKYQLASEYPTKAKSRAYAAGVFGRLPWRNPGFVTAIGFLHMLLMGAMVNAAEQLSAPIQRLVTIPLLLMVGIVIGSTLMFAMPATGGRRGVRHRFLGFAHGLAHVGLGAAGTWAWLQLPVFDLPWPVPILIAIVLYLPAVGYLASLLVSSYLLVASGFNVNVNELFAAQGIIDSKSFLRMHIGRDGTLTIYPFAVDQVGRRWAPNPDAPPERPWLEPDQPIGYRLVEQPIRVK
jgi:hypothetical protein